MENSSRFFKNTECSYFPCHKNADRENSNCLFCYCPLYSKIPCPGNPTYIKKEDGRIIKRCTDCTFPHKSENYDKIMSLLKKPSESDEIFTEYHHGDEFYEDRHASDDRHCERSEAIPLTFSVNTNPLGIPEGVKNAILSSVEQLSFYPDQNCTELRKKIADRFPATLGMTNAPHHLCERSLAISFENIICGNGASELISLFTQAISPKNALIVAPTFSGYEKALKICYSKIHYLEQNEWYGQVWALLFHQSPFAKSFQRNSLAYQQKP